MHLDSRLPAQWLPCCPQLGWAAVAVGTTQQFYFHILTLSLGNSFHMTAHQSHRPQHILHLLIGAKPLIGQWSESRGLPFSGVCLWWQECLPCLRDPRSTSAMLEGGSTCSMECRSVQMLVHTWVSLSSCLSSMLSFHEPSTRELLCALCSPAPPPPPSPTHIGVLGLEYWVVWIEYITEL